MYIVKEIGGNMTYFQKKLKIQVILENDIISYKTIRHYNRTQKQRKLTEKKIYKM